MDKNNFKEEQVKKRLMISELKIRILFDLLNGNINEVNNSLQNLQLIKESGDIESTESLYITKNIDEFLNDLSITRDKINEKNELIDSLERKIENLNLKLAEADKSKSEFIANTSHELRTPLNAIMGYLELVREGLYESVEEMRDFVDGAQKSAAHLLKLLNDIIEIARLESGKISVHFGEVDLKRLLEEVHIQNNFNAVNKGVEFQLDLPEENIKVRGDADKIKQIFNNLLSNALKFTRKGGKVLVKAREIASKNHVLCEVIDTGIGISIENRKKIFDKFFQIDGSSTREFGGAGLGLSITKSFVELLGGFIGVYSEGKDKGSRFYFTLPIYQFDKEFDLNERFLKDDVYINGNSDNPLILVVEDDFHYRKYLNEILIRNGYSTMGAYTADDGLARIKEYKPKLVILDFALPRREISDLHTGVDLFRLLQSQPEFENIPILLISGHQLELIKMFYEKLNITVDRFFEKPINSVILLNKIKELIKD